VKYLASATRSIIDKRWAIVAILMGILVGFISAYLCIIYHLIIFGFNIMYIISPLMAGVVETVIARRKYGRSTGAISALITFLLINIYGWFLPGIFVDPTKEPASLSFITIIAIILTLQAAFPILMNYILFVIGLGLIRRIIAFMVFLPSKIRGQTRETVVTKEIAGQGVDEIFLDGLDIPLLSIPPVEGGRVKKSIGLVIGEAVAQETETNGFVEKLSKINEPTNLDDFNLGDARKVAISRMFENAKALGANTVVDVSLDYNSMGGFQGSALIITATGTAVIYE
jgi:uncharacterized protein YbjQ (UPF0145 family)